MDAGPLSSFESSSWEIGSIIWERTRLQAKKREAEQVNWNHSCTLTGFRFQQSTYRMHIQTLIRKGTAATLAMRGAVKSTWGPDFKYICQLFIAVIAPIIDDAAIIWHKLSVQEKQLMEISTIQCIAMKTITGCFGSTPSSALEVETDLLPLKLRLHMKILWTITQMKSAPKRNPIHRVVVRHTLTMNFVTK